MASTDTSSHIINEQEAIHLIRGAGKIHIREFRIALGVLTGVALVCFIGRIYIRVRFHKRLLLDDAFLVFAACCLCAGTGLLLDIAWFVYMHTAASQIPELLPYLLANYQSLLNTHVKVFPLTALQWTAIFAVKACFLVFMRPLVWHISKGVNRYYWFVVWFSGICWAFAVSDAYIICPYFGDDAGQCLPYLITPIPSQSFS